MKFDEILKREKKDVEYYYASLCSCFIMFIFEFNFVTNLFISCESPILKLIRLNTNIALFHKMFLLWEFHHMTLWLCQGHIWSKYNHFVFKQKIWISRSEAELSLMLIFYSCYKKEESCKIFFFYYSFIIVHLSMVKA